MPRIARITVIDYPHHVVQRGNNRQLIYFDDLDRRLYLNLLRKYSMECNCRVGAYCLMKDHVHLLLTPLIESGLSKMMQKLSLRYTQHINKKYNRTGRLWECRFYASVIEKDSRLWTVCRYIERNPVRAEVVAKPEDYEWSSAGVNIVGRQNSPLIEPIWYNEQEKKEYIKFLHLPEMEEEKRHIRSALYTGRPTGTVEFIEQIANKLGIKFSSRPKGRPKK